MGTELWGGSRARGVLVAYGSCRVSGSGGLKVTNQTHNVKDGVSRPGWVKVSISPTLPH